MSRWTDRILGSVFEHFTPQERELIPLIFYGMIREKLDEAFPPELLETAKDANDPLVGIEVKLRAEHIDPYKIRKYMAGDEVPVSFISNVLLHLAFNQGVEETGSWEAAVADITLEAARDEVDIFDDTSAGREFWIDARRRAEEEPRSDFPF